MAEPDLERGAQLQKSTTDDGIGATAPHKIPEALHPITYNECCVPAIHANYGRPNDMKCFGTCYNERACHDPSYPYANMLERKKYGHLKELVGDERKLLRQRCVFKPEYLVPNVTWCSKQNSGNDAFAPVPRPGCSLVTNGGGSGPWQNVFIFPRAKLAFCGIPKGLFLACLLSSVRQHKPAVLVLSFCIYACITKVGITQWIQFARFVAGAKDYPSLPHYKLDNDFFRFDKLNTSVQEEIWTSKDWTWAVFLREPAERLLSAYLDKVAKQGTQEKVQKALGFDTSMEFGFEQFVERLSIDVNKTGCKMEGGNDSPSTGILNGMTGLGWCSDPRKSLSRYPRHCCI